jgi:hypothetical protein
MGLLAAAPGAAQHDLEGRKVALRASLDYYYGDWKLGPFDLDPRIGMIGPRLDLYFLEGKLGTGVRYVSGDFDGTETVAVPDPSYGSVRDNYNSRKEMSLNQSREDVYLYAMVNPLKWLGLELGYRYLDFQLNGGVDLVSDNRAYGSGSESLRSEARGAVLGARVHVPFKNHWAIFLNGQAMPWLDTEVKGSYTYDLVMEERTLQEDWARNGNAVGLYGEAALEFTIPGEPVALRLGYIYSRTESDEDVEPTWVDDSLGQTSRDWQEEEFQGVVLGAKFLF